MYWLARSGTKRRTTAMMPALAYRAATTSPSKASMASERRNGGISSRQKARRRLPYLTYMPTLTTARFVASKHDGSHGPGRQQPDGDRLSEIRPEAATTAVEGE